MIETSVFETKQNIWRNAHLIIFWLVFMIFLYFMTPHLVGAARFGAAPWVIGGYLIGTLFETRIEISETQLSYSMWFAGIKKLWSGKKYALASFERAEVFKLPQKHILYITPKAGKRVIINLNDFTNADDLIAIFGQHVTCDPTPITTDKYGLDDLGKRVGRVIFASAILLVVTGILAFCFAIRIHQSPIHFHREFWLIVPLTIIGLYPYIKKDEKASPAVATILSGIFLGSTLVFTVYILLQLLPA